MNDPQEREDYI